MQSLLLKTCQCNRQQGSIKLVRCQRSSISYLSLAKLLVECKIQSVHGVHQVVSRHPALAAVQAARRDGVDNLWLREADHEPLVLVVAGWDPPT